MDIDNQNKAKNVDYRTNTIKNKNSFKGEKTIKFLDQKLQNNKPSPNQKKDKAKFNTNKAEAGPKQKENKSNDKPENNDVSNNNKKNGKSVEDFKSVTVMQKPPQKKKNMKKSFQNKVGKKPPIRTKSKAILDELSCDTFELEDIMHNESVLELFQSLVDSFTCNSTLQGNELQLLRMNLFKSTCSVFLNILNDCVRKTFIRVINSNFFQEMEKKPVSKRDACCQTFSDIFEDKYKVQQNVLP